jgi:hypothetical protein
LADTIITRKRSFIKAFVENVEVYDGKVKMPYTIPVSSDGISNEEEGVFPFVCHGRSRGG